MTMRHVAPILAVAIIACAAPRPHLAPSGGREEIQRQLMDIENEIARANRECDYAYFRRIEGDEFFFTDASGGVTTREQDLAGEKDCKKSDYAQTIDEPRLLSYGNVAVLSARSNVMTTRNGAPVTLRSRFTDVFVWRNGRWQLVTGHASRISP